MDVILSVDEAVSLVLYYAKNNKIKSTTTLQKTVARLQKYLIPLDFEFLLNKYGSDCAELRTKEESDFFSKQPYTFSGGSGNCFLLKEKGFELAKESEQKIRRLIPEEDIVELKDEIEAVSSMSSDDASKNEHSLLLVDLENREKLINRVNSVHIDLLDLHDQLKEVTDERTLTYNALIEYLFYLSKFLKEKRFQNIDEEGYTYEKEMYDYYLLLNIEQLITKLKDSPSELWLEKTYEKFVEFGKANHVFSIENPDLMRLMQ